MLQQAQLVYRRRALILFEGTEGSGLRATLKRLVGSLDPCHVATHCTGHEDKFDSERHWMASFWETLPSGGNTSLYLRSWYRRLADAHVAGLVDDKALERYGDEINEFEAQQGDHDTIVIKLYFDVAPEVQAERLAERAADPWKRLLSPHDAPHARERRDDYRATWNKLFAMTDTRWAPWTLVNGSDKQGARIAALRAIADTLEKALPAEPPRASGEIVDFPFKARG